MRFYEIYNTKIQESAQVIAKDFITACHSIGWEPYNCRCVWKAHPENAGNPANY